MLDQIRPRRLFAFATDGAGQIAIDVYVAAAWEEEHGVVVDLVISDERCLGRSGEGASDSHSAVWRSRRSLAQDRFLNIER